MKMLSSVRGEAKTQQHSTSKLATRLKFKSLVNSTLNGSQDFPAKPQTRRRGPGTQGQVTEQL